MLWHIYQNLLVFLVDFVLKLLFISVLLVFSKLNYMFYFKAEPHKTAQLIVW